MALFGHRYALCTVQLLLRVRNACLRVVSSNICQISYGYLRGYAVTSLRDYEVTSQLLNLQL